MNQIEICNKLGFDWKIRKNRYIYYLPHGWKLVISRNYVELFKNGIGFEDHISRFNFDEFIKDIFTYEPELIPSFEHLLYEPDGIGYNRLLTTL